MSRRTLLAGTAALVVAVPSCAVLSTGRVGGESQLPNAESLAFAMHSISTAVASAGQSVPHIADYRVSWLRHDTAEHARFAALAHECLSDDVRTGRTRIRMYPEEALTLRCFAEGAAQVRATPADTRVEACLALTEHARTLFRGGFAAELALRPAQHDSLQMLLRAMAAHYARPMPAWNAYKVDLPALPMSDNAKFWGPPPVVNRRSSPSGATPAMSSGPVQRQN